MMRKATGAALLVLASGAAWADVVTEWNAIAQQTVAPAGPYQRTRAMTIVQVAVFEAVNTILGDYEPYLDRIAGSPQASPQAAAVSAAHRVLITMHPEASGRLDSLRDASLAKIPDGSSKTDGVAIGVAAAVAILEDRANDGSAAAVPYTPGTRPGEWRPTPPDLTAAFLSHAAQIRPFVLRNLAEFRAAPPPAMRSGRYARDYREVQKLGARASEGRPRRATDVARFYEVADGVEVYFPAARQVSAAQKKTLSENARIFALLSMAMFDAAIACFESKYHYSFWRPVTAIRQGDADGNGSTRPDTSWQPLVFTPPFPSYPSGHAAFGAAARRVLEHVYGPRGHAIVLSHGKLPDIVLHYESWKDITDDIDDGRVLGGVHFRFDQEAAARQGGQVGEYILRHGLRPRRAARG